MGRGKARIRPRPEQLWGILKAAGTGWWNDNVPRMGAALAYYTLFALAPVLIVAIAVGGMIFGAEAVRGQIVGQIEGLVGRDGAQTIQTMLAAAGGASSSSSILVTVIGVVIFFLGATGAFLELQDDLNAIWHVVPRSRGKFLHHLVLTRMISAGQILGLAFLLLTALVVSATIDAVSVYVGATSPGAGLLWEAAHLVVSVGVITVIFAMIYQVLPNVELSWTDVWVGALITATLFTIGKILIGLYLGASTISSTYGAAGSVIVVLVWVYYSAQIVLFGAELTKAYVQEFGHHRAE